MCRLVPKPQTGGLCSLSWPQLLSLHQPPGFQQKRVSVWKLGDSPFLFTLKLPWDLHIQLVNIFGERLSLLKRPGFLLPEISRKENHWTSPKALPDSHNFWVFMTAKGSHLPKVCSFYLFQWNGPMRESASLSDRRQGFLHGAVLVFSVYLGKPLFISIISPRVTPESEFLCLTNEDLLSWRGNEHQTLGLVSGT